MQQSAIYPGIRSKANIVIQPAGGFMALFGRVPPDLPNGDHQPVCSYRSQDIHLPFVGIFRGRRPDSKGSQRRLS